MRVWITGITIAALCLLLSACGAGNKGVLKPAPDKDVEINLPQAGSTDNSESDADELTNDAGTEDENTESLENNSNTEAEDVKPTDGPQEMNPTPSPSPSTDTEGSSEVVSQKPADPLPKPTEISSKPAEPSPEPTKAPAVQTVKVVIPEGYSLSQIGSTLEANGVCKKADFLATANSYDFSYYPLVKEIPTNENRCYKLEGYLFPDTYEFYINMKPQDAIGKMLRGTESKIGTKYSYPGMTTDQIITLASIIEREARSTEDMKMVSSVFHNRLKAKMKLMADATIVYIESYVKPNLTGDINRYNSYYNTYKCSALPAGPISNSGARALKAAVEPADTDYLYFVVDKSGKFYYSITYEEHLENCKLAGIS